MVQGAAGVVLFAAGAAAVGFLHLRHLGLIGLAVLAPVPGLALLALLGAAAGAFQSASLAGVRTADLVALVWLFGFVAGFVVADEMAVQILAGTAPGPALRGALLTRWRALAAAGAMALAALLCLLFVPGQGAVGLCAALALAAAAASVAALMPLARFLPFGEDFVTRSNRMRERLGHLIDRLIAVTRPRWGFAVTGIALVFAVLAGFGAQPLMPAPALGAQWWLVLPAGAAAILAAAAATGDWRATLSTLLALALAAGIGLWALARRGGAFAGDDAVPFALVLACGATLLFAAGAESGRFGRADDDATIASARMLMRLGPGLMVAALAMVAGLLLLAPWRGGAALAWAAMAGFAGAGPPLFQPAFAIVIETWLPRPATLAARYRLH